jgi:LEA14-like dessication related protein
LGSAIVAGLVFLTLWARRQYKKYHTNVFEFVGVSVGSLNLRRISITFFFRYVNNTDVSFYVKNQRYNVYFNGELVKVIDNPDRVDIPGNTETKIPVKVDFSPGEAFKAAVPNLNALLYDRSKLKIKIKGYFTAGALGVEGQHVPVDYVDTLSNMMGEK